MRNHYRQKGRLLLCGVVREFRDQLSDFGSDYLKSDCKHSKHRVRIIVLTLDDGDEVVRHTVVKLLDSDRSPYPGDVAVRILQHPLKDIMWYQAPVFSPCKYHQRIVNTRNLLDPLACV